MTPSIATFSDIDDTLGLWKNLIHKEYFGRCWSVKPKLPQIMILWIMVAVIGCHLSLVNGDKENKIVGLVGKSAELPCDVNEDSCGKVYFITWTKNVSNEWKRLYLYSDQVAKPLQELANPNRANFTLGKFTGSLNISQLRLEDDGIYKCDVTYVQGKCPSLSYATLFIHAEPSAPVIKGDRRISPAEPVVGPYNEGSSLSLECETEGGKPTPNVTWYKVDEELYSERLVTVEKNGASKVTSKVRVTLERDDLGKKIECRVSNEATPEPLVTWVTIDLHVRPLTLEVTGPTEPVIAGQHVSFTCTIDGAKPAANATWYNQSEKMDLKTEQHIEPMPDGTFRTISEIEVPVSRHDDATIFYCMGTNVVLQIHKEGPLLESLDIDVHYPPAVEIGPDAGITANVSESVAIYCTYQANPPNVTEVHWYHEDKELAVPTAGKYVPSGQGYPTLTIANIEKEDRGMYSCSLRNTIGIGNSTKDVKIDVLYPPTVESIVNPPDVQEGESISVFCALVDGNPSTLTHVRWFKDGEKLRETTLAETKWLRVKRNITGNYSCEGQNAAGWGERSEETELIVQYMPGPAVIEEQATPAIKGDDITLHCSVEEFGVPPAEEYRWEKDGTLFLTTSEPELRIENARVNTPGNYSCAAFNNVGLGPKGFLLLEVYAPPDFIIDLPTIRGAARDAHFINMTCHVECSPLCQVQWMKDDELIQDSSPYIITNRRKPPDAMNERFESRYSTLLFNMTMWPGRKLARERDRANYTCFSTDNEVGKGVSSTTLFLVEYPPEHLSLSETQVDVVEGNIPDQVECSASSWPPSTFLWKIGNTIVAMDDTLVFNESSTRENDGNYVCVARNRHGVAQIEMKLNVLYKPECVIRESTDEDGYAVLVCTADGNPALINFTWIKDNDTLEDEYPMKFERTRSILSLPDKPERYGMYECIAINDIGKSEPCEKLLEAPIATGYGEIGDMSVLVIAAIIGGIAIVFVLIIIIIMLVMRKRRMQNAASPAKQVPATGGDSLYQNVSGTPADRKQNGPSVSESEGNVMYENMPFHRQGPYRPDSTDEMVYADLYDDIKAGKVPDPRLKPPLPPKGIGKKPKEPPLPPKTKKGGSDFLGI